MFFPFPLDSTAHNCFAKRVGGVGSPCLVWYSGEAWSTLGLMGVISGSLAVRITQYSPRRESWVTLIEFEELNIKVKYQC